MTNPNEFELFEPEHEVGDEVYFVKINNSSENKSGFRLLKGVVSKTHFSDGVTRMPNPLINIWHSPTKALAADNMIPVRHEVDTRLFSRFDVLSAMAEIAERDAIVSLNDMSIEEVLANPDYADAVASSLGAHVLLEAMSDETYMAPPIIEE